MLRHLLKYTNKAIISKLDHVYIEQKGYDINQGFSAVEKVYKENLRVVFMNCIIGWDKVKIIGEKIALYFVHLKGLKIFISHIMLKQAVRSLMLSYQKKAWLAPATHSLLLILHRI